MNKGRFFYLMLLLLGITVIVGCDHETVMPASGLPDQQTVDQTASQTIPGDSAKLSLYAMSECPFGVPAEKVVYTVKKVLTDRLDVRLVFIVHQAGSGDIQSLHGPSEVKKNTIQACVGQLVPAKQLEFVVKMNDLRGDWEKAATQMEIDAAAIDQCLTGGMGKKILLSHIQETEALGVNASPTIIINGVRYNGGVNSREIFDAVCKTFSSDDAPAICANPPDTLSRTDGAGAGSCGPDAAQQALPDEMVDKTPFEHPILYDPNALDNDRIDEVLKQTKRIFPAVQVKRIDATSRQGKKMIERYEVTRLPAFLFPVSIANLKNFKHMERYLKQIEDMYLLDPAIGSNLFVNRPAKVKAIDVFFSPFSTKAMRILLDIHDLLTRPDVQALKVQINLRPYAIFDAGQLIAKMGPAEIEEMLRILAVMESAPEKIWDYLKVRYENPTSSWWEDYLAQVGLDPAEIKKLAQSEQVQKVLEENSRFAEEIEAVEEIVFLVENRELLRVEGKQDFKEVLFKIGRR